jgi:hypothetical protein
VKGILSQDERKVAELNKLSHGHRHFKVHHHHTHTRKTMNSTWKLDDERPFKNSKDGFSTYGGAGKTVANQGSLSSSSAMRVLEEEKAMAMADASRNPLSPLPAHRLSSLGGGVNPVAPPNRMSTPDGNARETSSSPIQTTTMVPRNTRAGLGSQKNLVAAMAEAELSFASTAHEEGAGAIALRAKMVPEVGETGVQMAVWEQMPKSLTPAACGSKLRGSLREEEEQEGRVEKKSSPAPPGSRFGLEVDGDDDESMSLASYTASESGSEEDDSFADQFEDINTG